MDDEIWSLQRARVALDSWSRWSRARDYYVIKSREAGLSFSEIARRTGLSRDTVKRITGSEDGQ